MADIATLVLEFKSDSARVILKDVNEVTAATARGEKSVGAMARAVETMEISFKAADGAVNKTSSSLVNLDAKAKTGAQSLQAIEKNAKDIGTTLIDIGTKIAGGGSPFEIALNQGVKLSQLLGGAGLRGVIVGLGGALLNLLNPVNLIVTGLAAGAVALIQYFTATKDNTKEIDATIQKHDQTIRDIRSSWGAASSGISDYVAKSRGVLQAENIINGFSIRDNLKLYTDSLNSNPVFSQRRSDEIDKERLKLNLVTFTERDQTKLDNAYASIKRLDDELSKGGGSRFVASEHFRDFKSAIDDFLASSAQGRMEYGKLQQAIAEKIASEPANRSLAKLGDELLQLIATGVSLDGRLQQSAHAFDVVGNSAAAAARRTKEYSDSIAALNGFAASSISDEDAATKQYYYSRASASSKEERDDASTAYHAALQRIKDQRLPPSRPTSPSSPHISAAVAPQKTATFDDVMVEANKQLSTLKQQQAALGLSEEAAAKLRHQTELLNLAQQKNVQLGPQQKDSLIAVANEMATVEIATKRAQEAMSFAKDLTKGFISDLKSGLKNGESFWKSFSTAAVNALNKIADKLLNDVLDSLFKVNSAASGGGGGGGFLSGLLGILGFGGGGGGGKFDLATGANAPIPIPRPTFADGGYTGAGGIYEPAGIVHAGEVVWSQRDIARAGGVGVVEAMRLGRRGYADGGVVGEGGPQLVRAQPDAAAPVRRLRADNQNDGTGSASGVHVTVGVSVDEDGNLKAYVKNVAQSEAQSSTRQGLNDFNQQLPDRVAQINRNPRRR